MIAGASPRARRAASMADLVTAEWESPPAGRKGASAVYAPSPRRTVCCRGASGCALRGGGAEDVERSIGSSGGRSSLRARGPGGIPSCEKGAEYSKPAACLTGRPFADVEDCYPREPPRVEAELSARGKRKRSAVRRALHREGPTSSRRCSIRGEGEGDGITYPAADGRCDRILGAARDTVPVPMTARVLGPSTCACTAPATSYVGENARACATAGIWTR